LEFDPNRPPSTPRDAATVILLRTREDGEAEVFLVRRHKKASFMAQAFVFPGGARDGTEDLRVTAARELFEEAGVLLADRPVEPEKLASLRERLAAGASFDALLAEAGVALDLSRLVPWAHWITPSAEKRRFSARFFAAELPVGQIPSFDDAETIEEAWVTPREALARSKELFLPPPQLRTFHEVLPAAARGTAGVLELARARSPHVRPCVPRLALLEEAPSGFALVLPWEPSYTTVATGEGEPMAPDHPLAGGPGRFVLDQGVWRFY
jgi:8-oxo-dGTP pyrophosphatase MutT (NUDIX family)